MKKKLTMLVLFSVMLTGCDFNFFSSSSSGSSGLSEVEDSQSEDPISESSNPSIPTSDNPTSTNPPSSYVIPSDEDPIGEPTSYDGSEGSQMPVFSNIGEADLATFVTDKIVDPDFGYKDSDYTVRPFLNGFTYPEGVDLESPNAYLEFWHQTTSLDIRIVASNWIFSMIQEHGLNANKDLYWPVTLQVIMNEKSFTYYEVGMRMKGNTSRRTFVDNNGNFYDNIGFKLSFNELWDEEEYEQFGLRKTWTEADEEWVKRDDRTFMGRATNNKRGLKKLDFKWNKSQDKSLIMQPFVFSFFQKHGIISQNSTLATLKYNDTHMGIVTINEPVTKHLFYRYLPTEATDGDLYKVGWGFGSMGNLRYEHYHDNNAVIGEENKFTGYEPTYDRKEGDENDANLINLMQVLKNSEGKTPAQYKAALENVVDMDSFLTYAALSYLAGNPDDMRNNGNNYYIYFNPAENNKAYFIPYDYDWSLGLTWSGDVSMFGLSPLSTKHQGNGRSWQSNRLYWYTIASSTDNERPYKNITLNQEYQAAYISKIHAFDSDPMYTVAAYNNLYGIYKETYMYKSMSDLDNGNDRISPFAGTMLAGSFIASNKVTIQNDIPR